MSMSKWLEQATSKIEFTPDREAVRRELADHLQDRQSRYAARGLPPEEAEAAAVADMGDPVEVAEELGKLHAPWWGYLWRVSQWALGLSVFALIFTLLWNSAELANRFPIQKDSHLWEIGPEPPAVELRTLPGRVKVGTYTVSVSTTSLELSDGERLFLSLRFVPLIPWEPLDSSRLLYNAVEQIVLTDDSNRLYSMGDGSMGDIAAVGTGPVRSLEFCLHVEDGPPMWVDIPLGDHTVRVDLEKGVLLR